MAAWVSKAERCWTRSQKVTCFIFDHFGAPASAPAWFSPSSPCAAAQKSLHWLHLSPTPQSVPAEMQGLSQFSTTHLTKYRANSWIFENVSNMVRWTYNEFWQTNKWWPPTNGDPHPQSAWRWPICCAAPMSRALVVSFVLRQDIFKTSPDVKTDMVFALVFWLFTVGIPFGSPLSSLCLARVALRWFFENVRWVAMGPNQFIKILTPMSSKRGQVALSSWLWAAWHCIPRCHQSSDLHAGLTGERPQSPHFRWSTTWTSQRVCCRGMFQLLWSNLRTCSPKVYSRFFAEIVLALLHSANKSLAVAPRQWCHPKLSTSTQHRPLCVLIWELQLLDGTALPFPSLDRNFAWIVLDVPGGKNGLQVGTDLQVIFSMPKSRNTYKGDAKISLHNNHPLKKQHLFRGNWKDCSSP